MLGNFHVRTDLALEARESFEEDDVKIRGVRVETREDEEKEIRTTLVKIETENGARTMGKPVGTYITMEARDTVDWSGWIITGRFRRSWHII